MTTEQKLLQHRDLLIESLRMHLVPTLMQQGFSGRLAPSGPASENFPLGRLIRFREPVVDLVEIQFSSYGRAAFRLNACAVPKEGMMTLAGHRSVEELHAGGLHDHFETHARPWLRPGLRALGLEPLGAWFSLSLWRFRSTNPADYDRLAVRVAGLVPEIELALREDKLGPRMRQIVFPANSRARGSIRA